jgi:glycosyltransferase involved in cell wall biosynthesis
MGCSVKAGSGVSVAMCTYNGAAFVAEQLASIAAQDLLPDELVVCDDCSTDRTAAIVRRFAASAPFEVRLEINQRNLGARENFAKAVGLCRGRWIALADQDDVWRRQKLRRLRAVLAQDPGVGLVFSDAALVDAAGRDLGCRLWSAVRFTARQQRLVRDGRAMDVLLKHNVVTGATMAFAAEHRDLVLPIPAGWVHDGWFALLIAAVARCAAIDEPLVAYRQHAGQQIGAKKPSLYEHYLRAKSQKRETFLAIAANYRAAYERLASRSGASLDGSVLRGIKQKVAHFLAKARMRRTRWRLPLVGRELLRRHYTKYSSGLGSLAQDLLL